MQSSWRERMELSLHVNNTEKPNAESKSKLINYYSIKCPCAKLFKLYLNLIFQDHNYYFPHCTEGNEATRSLQDLPK